ncbi:MAG: LrgB family protein [Solirubrobacterales bacterium]|nr:LrgB family protein [Solirubrobacterales bacterium]
MVELACLLGTLAAYGVGLRLQGRTSSPLANPTLIAILVIGAVLELSGLDYGRYEDATDPIAFLLGPAVVALAVPLYVERATLLDHTRHLLLGVLAGASVAMALGALVAWLARFSDPFTLAVTTRTATSPVSIAIAEQLDGGAPALSAVLSISSGLFAATFGPSLLDRLGVRLPVARGLAMGVTGHGIGTARMLQESRLAGATSSVGMGLGGLTVALVVPGLWGL